MLAQAVDSVDPAARLHNSLPDSCGPVVAEKKSLAPNATGNEGRLSIVLCGESQLNCDATVTFLLICVIFCVIEPPFALPPFSIVTEEGGTPDQATAKSPGKTDKRAHNCPVFLSSLRYGVISTHGVSFDLPKEAKSRGNLLDETPLDLDAISSSSSPLPVNTQNSAGDVDTGNLVPAGNNLNINEASSAGEGPEDVVRNGGREEVDGHSTRTRPNAALTWCTPGL
jgi:hypothetical protein